MKAISLLGMIERLQQIADMQESADIKFACIGHGGDYMFATEEPNISLEHVNGVPVVAFNTDDTRVVAEYEPDRGWVVDTPFLTLAQKKHLG